MSHDCYIRILDSRGKHILSELTEHVPGKDWSPEVFERLQLESVNPGGFTTASFTLHRPVEQFWNDIQYKNHVKIGRGPDIYWEGYIDKPTRGINPDTIQVDCMGWSAELKQLWTTSDITVTGSTNNQLSDFLVNVVLADSNISLIQGTIETGDFAFANGTRFEFAPATFYFDVIEQMNAANNYDWGVWENRAFDFKAKSNKIDWLVHLDDCSDLQIAPNVEALCTYVLVNYTQDGSHYQQVTAEDTNAQAMYGVIKKRLDLPGKVKTSDATQIADTYIAECSTLTTSASFTCNRIYDIYGAEHHLAEVRGGDVVRLVGWLATEGAIYSNVDSITTFQIKSARYNNDAYSLDITPTEFLPSAELAIARLQAVGY